MRTYVIRRFLQIIPLLFGISALTFLLLQLAPGDFLNQMAENPAISAETIDAMRRRFGLDRPWYVQYGLYLKTCCCTSTSASRSRAISRSSRCIREGLGNTLLLAGAAAVVTWGLAIPLGVIGRGAAVLVDRQDAVDARLHLAVDPRNSVWSAAAHARRADGMVPGRRHALDRLRRAEHRSARSPTSPGTSSLPALVVGLVPLAGRMRQMRGNLLDVLRLDYVTTARAKGLDERIVVFKHAVRNAINPLITLFGYTLGALVSGSFIAEIIFSWPGLGRITLDAILTQDQYLVMGSVLMASVVLILGNLIADLLLALADPRISYD